MSNVDLDSLLGRLALHFKVLREEQLAEALRRRREKAPNSELGDFLVGAGLLSQEAVAKLRTARSEYLKRHSAEVASPAPATSLGVVAPAPTPPPAESPVIQAMSFRPGSSRLNDLLRRTLEVGASDLHVHASAPLKVRLHGRMVDASAGPLSSEEAERLLGSILMPAARERLEREQQLDYAHALDGVGRFRVNLYRQQRGLDGVFRAVPAKVPTLAELGVPEALRSLTEYHQGLVLLTGPAGCGKSSTMAALVQEVAYDRPDHIITLEDPIEYVYESRAGLVNQREVGSHTASFARALRAALREDPDVIVIGELRDLETIQLALTAAETGHLVFGTLHTGSALRTINRLLGVFPTAQQAQVRTMLSESLRAVVSQRLVPRADGSGRIGAFELLVNTKAIANLIRDNKAFQIPSQMQMAQGRGMLILDNSLAELVKTGVVTREEALRFAEDPKRLSGQGGS
jgi:twitching motility protein PilT